MVESTVAQEVASAMLVYFDTCAVQRPLDDLSQLRVRLEADAVVALIELCETGFLELVASAVHGAENAENPYPDRHAHAANVLSLASHYAPATPAVVGRAAEYERAGIKRLDALHLASAVVAGAAFFCTTDDLLLRRGRSVETDATSVVSPLELAQNLP